jgi:hypothetical protein
MVLVLYNIYHTLGFGWLLSSWLLDLGYSSSTLLIKGISLLLAAGTACMIHPALQYAVDLHRGLWHNRQNLKSVDGNE